MLFNEATYNGVSPKSFWILGSTLHSSTKYLIEECKVDPSIKNNNGFTPLHSASTLDIVKYLVEECKVDPNIKDNNESTPLHFASSNGHLDIVKYLVEECKVDPNIKNKDGDTPLHFASTLDIVEFLTRYC